MGLAKETRELRSELKRLGYKVSRPKVSSTTESTYFDVSDTANDVSVSVRASFHDAYCDRNVADVYIDANLLSDRQVDLWGNEVVLPPGEGRQLILLQIIEAMEEQVSFWEEYFERKPS